MSNEKMKAFTFENLKLYDELLKGKMSEEDAKALKTVAIEGNTLKFYNITEPVGSTAAVFEITLPETDISNFITKIEGANAGNVVVAKADGTIEDGGIKLTDIATKAEVETTKSEFEGKIGTVTAGKTVVEMIEDAKTASTYDDTQVKTDIAKNKSDIATVVADYLKASDKTELTQAIATAKTEAIATIMGEAGVDEKYDTLKEVADWILADTTNSAALVAKVDGIYNDYLKGADKTELEGKINAVTTLVGAIPSDATSTTVVEYIKEVVDALKIGDYAKAADLTTLASRVATVESTCANLGALATKNKVAETDIETAVLEKINTAHTHENADELAKIEAGDKTKWDAMEQNAKTYADGLNTAVDKRVTELEDKVGEGFTEITEAEIRALFA